MAVLQKIKNLYRALPPWMTAGLRLVPDGILFGRSYRECSPYIDAKLYGANLKSALDYARGHTEWGREKIPAAIQVEDAEALIRTLPLVSSEELAEAPARFMSDEANGCNSYWTTTGGSGRNPTSICLCNSSYGVEWRHMHRIWNSWKAGGDPRVLVFGDKTQDSTTYERRRDVKLTFRGYHLKDGELTRFDPIYNEVSVDPFQLNEGNFDNFMKQVGGYNIGCIHGYPSLIWMFKERLAARGFRFPVKLIFLGSEACSVGRKRALAEFFDAKVVSWYGQTEKVVLAYDADASGRFVNFSSYGYPWILNPDDNGVGETVGTTFVNRAMPLVNYRTGDYGRISRVVAFGQEALVIDNVQGRWGKDFVYKTKQEKIPTSAINLHGAVQEKINFFQIVQSEYGKIEVKVLVKKKYDERLVIDEMERELVARLKGFKICCFAVRSELEFVRSCRGKMVMLVQSLRDK